MNKTETKIREHLEKIGPDIQTTTRLAADIGIGYQTFMVYLQKMRKEDTLPGNLEIVQLGQTLAIKGKRREIDDALEDTSARSKWLQ